MRRIAALAAIIFGLTTLVAVPAVIIAAPASALSCDASHHVETDGTGQQFCAQNSGTGAGASAPAMMSCWNGTSVPVTSACPVAPTTTYTPTTPSVTCPDGTSHPSGFVCPTTAYTPTTPSVTCPDGTSHPS
ncbi:MAG: hypothetical protein WCI25_08155, partial [Actinomycetes bacterium]